MAKQVKRRGWRQPLAPYIFIAPVVVYLLVFQGYPLQD
jgi:hypothetical protein